MKKLNPKVENLLKQKISHDDYDISFKEMELAGLKHEDSVIDINENTELQRIYLFTAYRIIFKDKRKDFDNRIQNEYVNSINVLAVLSEYKLTSSKFADFKKKLQAEVEWTKDLETYLKKYFVSVKRGSPNKPLEIDLDIGLGKVGLELKWADKINKNNPMQAVYGQMSGYKRNGNYDSLFLIVAGNEKLEQDANIIELQNLVKKDLNCIFKYIAIS